jgi:NAD(P)-dependent dehydrogenase (short-subunit alcohol dehydrogenase family)
MRLKEKIALITGATSGIGLATAKLFAQEGAKVGVLGKNEEKLQHVVEELEQWSEAIPLLADVSEPKEVQQSIEKVAAKWDGLDIVFANAGINGLWAPIEEITPEDWDRTINVNLKGTFLTVKYATPYLKRQGGSVIVNSSVNGTRMFSNTGATAYACSKAAQVAFTKMMALELAKHQVRVNAICPGAIMTDIIGSTEQRHLDGLRPRAEFPEGAIPLKQGQLGEAEEVAQLVLFLASNAANHITGTEMWIDGGQSLLQG